MVSKFTFNGSTCTDRYVLAAGKASGGVVVWRFPAVDGLVAASAAEPPWVGAVAQLRVECRA
jgi:hypothetical protein